jgi:prephenate dehydrogenase
MIDKKICIVGLGLMGGSLAKALKGQVSQLIGIDSHAATRQLALSQGIVDAVTTNLGSAARSADLLILATPVSIILDILSQLPQLCPEGCMVMDLGSTKQAICAQMDGLPPSFSAIGGHPMCGKETAGLHAADTDLFREQTFVLARNKRTNPQIEQLALAIIDRLGARPLFLPPAEHDQLVAVTSHLPYLISAALMHRAIAEDDARIWSVSASGFRDTSRLAGSDPRMMLDILLTNREAVLASLKAYQLGLAQVEELLRTEDEAALSAWLEEAQQDYTAYRRQKSSKDAEPS